MSRPVLAALDSGTYFHHFTFTDPDVIPHIDRVIGLRSLCAADLDGVDTLIVASRCNPDLLVERQGIVHEFLRSGGKRLVVLADTEPDTWLPNVSCTPMLPNFWWWLEPGADLGLTLDAPDHPMFEHLSLGDATWHYHGHFAVPPQGRSLISCAEGGSILYEDTQSWPGSTILLTTLDPCFHHGSFFMPGASRFLMGLLRYLGR